MRSETMRVTTMTKMAMVLAGLGLVSGCMKETQVRKTADDQAAVQMEYDEGASRTRPTEEAAPAAEKEARPAPKPTTAGRAEGSAQPSAALALDSPGVRRPAKKELADRKVTGGAVREPTDRDRRAEPEPKPRPNTEQYTNHGVNPMTATAEDAKSTFAIDVDTGSYTVARGKLDRGQMPPAASVRVEEFVNYFTYDYPNPDRGPFGVSMEAAPSPFAGGDEDRYLMRVGVQGKRVTRATRKPVHLTFLIDVSGSMNNRRKLGLAKRSLKTLTNNLQEGDTVALATYAGRTAKILDPTGIHKKRKIRRAINNLNAGGSTAMNSGLELAYKLALKNYQPDHVNRVLVMSDGDANVGTSSHRQILDRIRHFVDEGVTLSTIGFGMGNYKDTMMEQLANNGNGNYYYIDSHDEAQKVFGEQVDGTLQVIAKDVKIQVEFDPEAIPEYRLIGYENRDIADKDFRNDRVDAGEIGAGHSVTALYEVRVNPEARDKLATVRVRHKEPRGTKAEEQAFGYHASELRPGLSDASKDFQFATAVAGFAEILRDSPYAEDLSFDLIDEVASAATDGRSDRREFVELVRKAKSLSRD
jgi:Ca-activated chloride channel family protein